MTNIRNKLVNRSHELYKGPREFIKFSGNENADFLLNDIENYPHAYVLACIMNRQIRAKRVWEIPYQIKERLGSFDIAKLATLSYNDIYKKMSEPYPLHRFRKEISKFIHSAIDKIINQYESNAANIWNDSPSSATLIKRFLQFPGMGQKIATMAANCLVRDFKISVLDKYSIDISVDRQIKRVFRRLGLLSDNLSSNKINNEIIYIAREFNPEFPGLIDLSVWEIGTTWCKQKNPLCVQCYMNDVCPKNI